MKFKKSILALSSVAAVAAPVAAVVACGSTASKTDESKVYLTVNKSVPIYMVGDGGSLTDKTFNQGVLEGAQKYGTDNQMTVKSTQPDDGKIADGYRTAMREKASVVVGSGFKHGSVANSFFTSNGLGKNTTFIGVDTDFTSENNNRLASIQFKTEQAGYLAGIYAVAYANDTANAAWTAAHKDSKSGKIQAATYGGQKFLSVTSWMDGFAQGIEAANAALETTGTQVEMIYANGNSASIADFTNSFASPSQPAENLTTTYLNKGADIIFPVAGPQIVDTLKTIKSTTGKTDTRVFGVDGDQFKALQGNNTVDTSNIIGSALKGLAGATNDALKAFFGSIDANGKVGQSFIDEYVRKAHYGSIGFVAGANSTDTNAAALAKMVGFKAGTTFDETQAKSAAFAAVK